MTNKSKCKIISVVNQKGGVGKTTTSINLGAALAVVDKRVLIIDLDPQGNASTGLGVETINRKKSIYDVIAGNSLITDAAIETQIPNLSIIPSSVNLSAAEIELINEIGREFILKTKLEECSDSYDIIIIDCPPSLGLLTINALTASDSILIPMQCEFFALEGLSQLVKTVSLVQRKLNTNLEIEGIILTMFDKRNNLTEQVANDVRTHMKGLVFQTVIPRNVRISEAPSHGKPVILYDVNCAGSTAYIQFAKELLNKQKNTNTIEELIS